MSSRQIKLDDAKRIVENAIGRHDNVHAGEYDYLCPQCPRRGFSRRSHLHIKWGSNTPVALCHQCGAKAKTLEGILRVVLGYVPENAYRTIDSVNFLEDIDDLLYRDGPETDETADQSVAAYMPDFFRLLTNKPKDRVGSLVLDYLTGHDANKKQRGVPFATLAASGVGYCYDGVMRGYAVFPVTVNGELVTWTSRRVTALGPKQRHAYGIKSRRVLHNYDNCHGKKRIFITEGPFDAWAFHEKLFSSHGGVATLGTILHDEQAALLAELPAEEYILCYDQDATKKAFKMAEKLAKVVDGSVVSVMELPDARDPDEIPVDELRSIYKKRTRADDMSTVLRLLGSV